ncbi:MAG TPA: MFS transporter [Bryobacteraceae bacterium]|nr:MFS transporter [Bryobacteraceae bacterium]
MESTARVAAEKWIAPERPAYKWWLVALLFLIGALNYADRTAIAAVFPLLRQDLGTSDMALAAIGSLFLWSYALGSPLCGVLADRVSRSRLVVWSLTGWSLATILSGLVTATWQLLTARVLLGLSECAYLPAALALLADHHKAETRATAMGLHNAGLSFGLVAGGLAAGYIGEHFGWRPGFLALGTAGLLLAALARWFLRDVPRSAVEARVSIGQSLAALVRIPTYLIVLGEAALIAVGTWMFLNWLPLYFNEVHHLSLAGAGFSGTFLLQAPSVAGVALGGYLSDRIAGKHRHRRMLIQCFTYCCAAPCLLAFLGKPALLVVGMCLFGYGLFRSLGSCNETPILCDLLHPHLRSTAIGLMTTTNTLAGGAGIFLAAVLKRDFGLSGVFGGMSALTLVSAVLVMAGYRFFIRKDLARRGELEHPAGGEWKDLR